MSTLFLNEAFNLFVGDDGADNDEAKRIIKTCRCPSSRS